MPGVPYYPFHSLGLRFRSQGLGQQERPGHQAFHQPSSMLIIYRIHPAVKVLGHYIRKIDGMWRVRYPIVGCGPSRVRGDIVR